jgi:hypothetical protein
MRACVVVCLSVVTVAAAGLLCTSLRAVSSTAPTILSVADFTCPGGASPRRPSESCADLRACRTVACQPASRVLLRDANLSRHTSSSTWLLRFRVLDLSFNHFIGNVPNELSGFVSLR